MFSALRKRFHVTPATVIATLALVFAMTGGAYAAKRYLITSTKQISPKVLKALKGANGKNGAPGPAGLAGAAGTGTAGAQGAAGPAGAKGETGAAGAAGAKGEAGVKGANGTNGTTGFTETLPSASTETGAWSISTSNEELVVSAISFAIPLKSPLVGESTVHYVGPGHTDAACPGTASVPKANAGNLCVYQSFVEGVQLAPSSETAFAHILAPGTSITELLNGEGRGAGTTGAVIEFTPEGVGNRIGYGSWAVTAP
jgi:hypothetical protein